MFLVIKFIDESRYLDIVVAVENATFAIAQFLTFHAQQFHQFGNIHQAFFQRIVSHTLVGIDIAVHFVDAEMYPVVVQTAGVAILGFTFAERRFYVPGNAIGIDIVRTESEHVRRIMRIAIVDFFRYHSDIAGGARSIFGISGYFHFGTDIFHAVDGNIIGIGRVSVDIEIAVAIAAEIAQMHFVTHIRIHNSGNAVRVGLINFKSAGKIHPSGGLRRIFPIAIQAFGIFQLLLSQGLRNEVGMMDGITVFERIERECSAVIQVFFEINFVAVEEITGGIIAVLLEKVSVLR